MAKRTDRVSNPRIGKGSLMALLLSGIALSAGAMLLLQRPSAAEADILVYKSPTCGCCNAWVDHLRANGFKVSVQDRLDMAPIKGENGVPLRLQSCHTAQLGGYVIEGHVPAGDILRLLREKLPVKGLTVPGMPMGSPGMQGPASDPYEVLAFQPDGRTSVFARHNQ